MMAIRTCVAATIALAVFTVALTAAGTSRATPAATEPSDADVVRQLRESDRPGAPIDYGFGPGVRPPRPTARSLSATTASLVPARATTTTAAAAVPAAGADAHWRGAFGPAFTMPIIPIHVVLLPDGRVLSFGSGTRGQQGGFVTSIWNPALGPTAHTTIANGSPTDIFCAGQSVMAGSGKVLITGGDLTIGTSRNFSTADANVFDPDTQTLSRITAMAFPRWYPTVAPVPSGELVVLGGRESKDPIVGVATPEVYNPATGWRTLTTARNDAAYGRTGWYYPRAWQAPNGRLFILVRTGRMFHLDPAGTGSLTPVANLMAPAGGAEFTAIMYAPGQLLSVRLDRKVVTIDITRSPPVITPVADIDAVRFWATSTVLADGKVLVHGGSTVSNQLVGVSYNAQLWDPATRAWTDGATAAKPRLYHASALLLPDGSVFTGGGGSPGPARQLNGEIYYPPYLFKGDGSGAAAERPTVMAAPDAVQVGQDFTVQVAAGDQIRRATLIRSGSDTHAFNADQRFFDLAFSQEGETVSLTAPGDRNLALPGWYLLFLFNERAPAVARIIRVTG